MAEKEKYYIYHYCLNENLKDGHKDKCNNCFVDIAHGGANAYAPQNWLYCPDCLSKGTNSLSHIMRVEK